MNAEHPAATAPPGPHPLPECDYCGDDLHDPLRGYKGGCEKHDPFVQRRRLLNELTSDYGVVREVVRRSNAANVEIALTSLDSIYALAKEAIGL